MLSLVWLAVVTLLHSMSCTQSQLHFTLPEVVEDSTKTSSQNSQEDLRGIYHYSDSEQMLKSRLKIPDFEEMDPLKIARDLLSAAAEAETRRKTLSGIQIPLPFKRKPLSLQIAGNTRSALSLTDGDLKGGQTTIHTPETRQAFENAKKVCLQSTPASCDEALDTFHRVKFGSSLLKSSTDIDDPSTSIAKLLMPSLRETLSKMEEKADASDELSNITEKPEEISESVSQTTEKPRVASHPFSGIRLPYHTQSSSSLDKIRDFLHRIT